MILLKQGNKRYLNVKLLKQESQTQIRSGAKSGFFFVRAAFFLSKGNSCNLCASDNRVSHLNAVGGDRTKPPG